VSFHTFVEYILQWWERLLLFPDHKLQKESGKENERCMVLTFMVFLANLLPS
jgi:hypothetical protein